MATIIHVDFVPGSFTGYFDEDFPFLLQGRVDPEIYHETICSATAKVKAGVLRTVLSMFLFVMTVPALVLVPFIVASGLWMMILDVAIAGVGLVIILYIIINIRKSRMELESFLKDENRSYYNALGVNLKYHSQHRHSRIDIEILNNLSKHSTGDGSTDTAKLSEKSPLVYMPAQQQQQPQLPTFTHAQPVYVMPAQQQQPPQQNTLYPQKIIR